MLRGFALAILLLAGARAVAAQQPPSQAGASPTSAQSAAQAQSTSQELPCDASPPAPQQTPPTDAWHCITVTFDYDFTKTPACPGKNPATPCVSEFAIFETTAGERKDQRIPLFKVPVPPNSKGVVKGIAQQSPYQRDFVLGWHRLGVAALVLNGRKSTLKFCDSCATWIYVRVGPTTTPSVPAPGNSTTPPATPPPASAPPAPPE